LYGFSFVCGDCGFFCIVGYGFERSEFSASMRGGISSIDSVSHWECCFIGGGVLFCFLCVVVWGDGNGGFHPPIGDSTLWGVDYYVSDLFAKDY